MKDDRLRSPVKLDYIETLGRATYTFASLEWQVAWCAEKIKQGSIRKIVDEELTAGKIATLFVNLIRNMSKTPERKELKILAERFRELVYTRNEIIHGKPCTGSNGESRLSGKKVIEIPDLEQAADDFVECCGKLNSFYYGFLQEYEPTKD